MSKIRKGSMLLATASLFVLPAPSLAAVDTNFGTNPDADAACDVAMNPDDKSDFTTYAISVSGGTTSSVTTDNGPTVTAGVGTPTTTVSNYDRAHQNGQSVNIHAYADRLVTYASALATTPTKTVTTTTYDVGCHTHKPFQNGGNDNDEHQLGGETVRYNAPRGLESHTTTIQSEVTTYGSRTATVAGPWIDPTTSQYGVQMVICISPTKNPGTWRGANGYLSQLGRPCSTSWFNELGSTPSVSVPGT